MSAGISISIGIGVSIEPTEVGVDPDAQAFIIAAGITDPTQQEAINTLVVDLKASGLWTLLQAIYPIVGGTATTHKYNLKNPLDTDGAFRLTFGLGWTHGTTGMTPNGTTAFADTKFNPNADLLSYTSCSIGIYSRTDTVLDGVDIGASGGGSPGNIYVRPASTTVTFLNGRQGTPNEIAVTLPNTQGLLACSRGTLTSFEAFQNGSSVGSNATSMFPLPVAANFFLGARGNSGVADLFSRRELAFGVIGPRLNAGQNLSLYNSVQAYQTTLNREV